MLAAADTAVRALHLIGGTTFAGGMVMLGVAAMVARRTLPEKERIAFFRVLGRRFLLVGGIALLLAIATGTDMANDRDVWNDLTDTAYGKTLSRS